MGDSRDDNETPDRDEDDEFWEDREDVYEAFEDEHLYEDWDELAADPEEVSRLGRALDGLLPDVVKRSFGDLVKEDGLKNLVKERELPREAVGFILGQVDATKREVLRIVSREIRLFLQDVDLGGELTKLLTSVSFEIRTEVRFVPNDASVEPKVDNRVKVRGEDGEEKTLEEMEQQLEEARNRVEKRGDDDAGDDEESGDETRKRRWGRRRKSKGRSRSEDTDDKSD